ncbi:hypothetical protein FKP32DRAFT_1676757 [Trametes sanguinea]|nr:hypothetical protein FKP32DRAFT_1676757 [Trametes sanguinea]
MCEPTRQPSTPPPVLPAETQVTESTPASKIPPRASLTFAAHVDPPREALTRYMQSTPDAALEAFIAKVLPPLPEIFGRRDIAVEKVMEKLQSNGALKATSGTGYKWTSMKTQPKDNESRESKAFKPLERIVTNIEAAVKDCVWDDAFGKPEPRFQYKNAGDSKPDSYHRRSSNVSRPDGYFFPRGSQLQGTQKVHNWWDIGVVGEFKKKDNEKNREDDAKKVVWSFNTIMREDPRRRFVHGFTMENTTTRLWFCDRSQIASCGSEAFDFNEKPHFLISFFLSALYADDTAQGWDPTIVRVLVPQQDGEPIYQYDITVHSVSEDGRIEQVVYRTETLLSQVSADGIMGRGSRVWTAHRVITGTRKKTRLDERLVVLKDYWIDSDRKREGNIVNDLRKQALKSTKLPDEQKELFLEHIPTILHHGDVLISDLPDQTRQLQNIFKRDDTGELVTHDLVDRLRNAHETTDEGTRSHLSQSSYVDLPVRHGIALQDSKTHYRVVFKDYGYALHEETVPLSAFIAIQDVMRCLAILHLLGWVHRDISSGNILVIRGGSNQLRGMLTDFEYAKEYEEYGAQGSRHMTRTGTEYFMSVEVDSHQYLFAPGGPTRIAVKNNPQPEPEQPKSRLSKLLTVAKDDIVRRPQAPSQLLPFRYHPLNDWESLWWVSMYMVVDRIVEPRDMPKTRSIDKQRQIARRLFYTSLERRNLFRPGPLPLDAQLQSVIHPAFSEVLECLCGIRDELCKAYSEVEQDVTTRYPDAQRSLELALEGTAGNMFLICEHLEKVSSTLRLVPIPPKGAATKETVGGK